MALSRTEAKQIISLMDSKIKKAINGISTDGKFDANKGGIGKLKGGSTFLVPPEMEAYVSTMDFTSTDHNTIAWTGGDIILADGRTKAITSGGTDVGAEHFIYYHWGDAGLLDSATYSDTVGSNKLLMAVSMSGAVGAYAMILPFRAKTPTLNAAAISANTILAEHIKAGEISADKIVVGTRNFWDGKTTTFAQNDTPTATSIGDIWIDLDDSNKMYRAEATGTGDWVEVSAGDVGAVTFRSGTEPASGMKEGDIWIDTSNGDKPFTYSGSLWIASYTEINGGAITAGSIDLQLVNVQTSVSGYRVEIRASGIFGYDDTDTMRFMLSSEDGRAYAGGGAVYLDEDGLTAVGSKILIYGLDDSGINFKGRLGTIKDSVDPDPVHYVMSLYSQTDENLSVAAVGTGDLYNNGYDIHVEAINDIFLTTISGKAYYNGDEIGAGGGGGASTALDNLASVAINTTLVSDTADTDDLGTDLIPWRLLKVGVIGNGGGIKFIGDTYDTSVACTEPAANRTVYIPDFGGTDTLVGMAATQVLTNKTLTSPTINGTIGTTGLTLPAVTLGGNIAGGGYDITAIGDLNTLADAIDIAYINLLRLTSDGVDYAVISADADGGIILSPDSTSYEIYPWDNDQVSLGIATKRFLTTWSKTYKVSYDDSFAATISANEDGDLTLQGQSGAVFITSSNLEMGVNDINSTGDVSAGKFFASASGRMRIPYGANRYG